MIKFGLKTTNQIQARKMRVSGSHISFILKYIKINIRLFWINRIWVAYLMFAATACSSLVGVSDEIIIKAYSKAMCC